MPAIACSAVLVPLLLLAGRAAPQEAAAPPAIRWEPWTTKGADGAPLAGELGRFRVPERRGRADGPTIELAFVRFRTKNPDPGPPVLVLAGGPGASGVEQCVGPATGRLLRLLDHADVIGLDQRGTGLSRPDLASGPSFGYELPLDRPPTRADHVRAYGEAVERCVRHWRAQGVDLAAYDTEASADDVLDLCRALGLERVVTWGESYGTHLALAHLRRHPERVARSVLVRVEGPDDTWKLPSTLQRELERLGALVAADPGLKDDVPDLPGLVRELLARLSEEPVTLALEDEGRPLELVLGPYDLQSYLAGSLGFAFALRDLPASLARCALGDWSALGENALWIRRGPVGSPMALFIDCASGGSPERLRRLAAEAADPANVLGDAANAPYPDICRACGSPDLGAAFRAPFACDVPVLFVSGELDARTPPENAEALLAGFSRGVHVRVTNAGHEAIEMLSPDYRALLQAFLRGEPVESRTIELPPPRFRPLE